MREAPIPDNEADRLKALLACQILGTSSEPDFDDLTMLASDICQTPIALITLVDSNRQWFKSKVGIDAKETPRSVAFCSHAILQMDLFVVPDALRDERFADNPLVTSEPNIRFYAGAPLQTHSGHNVGTLCVIDRVPRELTPEQGEALRALGRQAVAQLELRRHIREHQELLQNLRDAHGKVKILSGLIPICASCKQIRDDQGYWNHVESYINTHSEADFSHDICPSCAKKLYPEVYKRMLQLDPDKDGSKKTD